MDQERLTGALRPLLEQLGLELDRIDVVPAGKRRLVRITVDGDGPDGHGPGLDDIASATTEISRALDESDLTGNSPYTLEVTSRGVSTPLTEPKHFRRNITRLVRIDLADDSAEGPDAKKGKGNRQVDGRIVAADATSVTLEVPAPGSKPHKPLTTTRRIELERIDRAVVQVELNRPTPDAGDGKDHDVEEN